MKRTVRAAWAVVTGLWCFALWGCGGGGQSASLAGNGSRAVSSRSRSSAVLCRLQTGVDAAALAQEYGVVVEQGSPEDNLYQFRAPDGQDPDSLAERLRQDPRLAAAEDDPGICAPESGSTVDGFPIHIPFDFVRRNSARYALLAAAFDAADPVAATGDADQAAYAQVNLGSAWGVTRGAGVTVAVLDTGIQADHPVLHSRLLDGYNAIIPDAPPDDVADGAQNQILGHGTMVAGIIARVAPEAKILPVRVLSAEGSGSVFNAVRGLRWAIAHGAQVVNLSFGTPTRSAILQDAVAEAVRAGIIVVAAAGNAGQETRDYPAGFRDVLAVASVEADGVRSGYSNFGAHIRLCAPGTDITSTFVDGGFATWSGTSFSAPFVSGAAALLRSARPGMAGSGVAAALQGTARSVNAANPGLAGKLGRGVLDVDRAVLSPFSSNARSSARVGKQAARRVFSSALPDS